MNCKYCNQPIRPGQPRTPLQAGGVMHEECGIRTTGKAEGFLFYCYDCDFATDKIDVVQGCPVCDSARAGLVPPAERGAWPPRNHTGTVRVCPECFEAFEYQKDWKDHDCDGPYGTDTDRTGGGGRE